MKWILLLILSVASISQAAVKSSYSLRMGQHGTSTLYWQHREIKKINVFVVGYQNANGIRAEQVVPKEEFNSNVKELKDWRTKLILKETPAAGPGCGDIVVITEGDSLSPICLQGTPRPDKVGFFRWYKQQTALASGRL